MATAQSEGAAFGVENFSTPKARFREGYREIPHYSRKSSQLSYSKQFERYSTLSDDVETMSKHSDDENVDFSLFDEFNSLS